MNNNKFLNFFINTAKPYKWWFVAMFFIGVYSSIHSVVQPYVLKVLLDNIAQSKGDNFIASALPASLLLVFLGFFVTLVWRIYNYVVLKSLPQMKADIVTISTNYLREQSYAFFQEKLSGDISNKISDLTSNIQSLVNSWFNISRQGLTILLSIFMAGTVSIYFSVIFFFVSVIFIFMSYYCASSIKPYAEDYATERSKYTGAIVDCFSNVLNMFLFARERYESQYLANNTNTAVETETKMQFKNMMNASLLGFFAWVLQALSILLLIYLGSKGLITVGDFAFIFILSLTVIDQIWFLTESLLVVGEQAGICQSAIDTIFSKHLQSEQPIDAKIKLETGKIELKNVNFHYEKGKNVVHDLNLLIPGGNKLGLVGFSGAGKSTIVQLITKLYDVDSGEIVIDDQNIEVIHRQNLREHIAFIPQQPSLFHRSIFENIHYGDPSASHEEVIAASKKAFADDFIMELPDKYETIVGERGVKLSGGQRQRIAIARAILKDAPILILDEATSSLDSMTEEMIKKSLSTAMENRTVIVIAHRLSTLISMDKIAVMDKGKIIEIGSHDELISQKGFYKNLWDAQTGHSRI